MFERMEFCPKCNGIRKMTQTLGLMPTSTEKGPDTVLFYNYHCTSCNTYVFSQPLEREPLLVVSTAPKFSIPAYA